MHINGTYKVDLTFFTKGYGWERSADWYQLLFIIVP